jgi:hypothetical protein
VDDQLPEIEYERKSTIKPNRWIHQPWADLVSGIVVLGLLASAVLWAVVGFVHLILHPFGR